MVEFSWVNSKKRLPEYQYHYLVIRTSGKKQVLFFDCKGKWLDGNKVLDDIKFWADIPELLEALENDH